MMFRRMMMGGGTPAAAFDPADLFGATAGGWWRPNPTTTGVSAESTVASMTALAGTIGALAQGTGAAQPTLKAESIGHSLSFDGGDYLWSATAPLNVHTGSASIFAIIRATGTIGHFVAQGRSSNDNPWLRLGTDGSGFLFHSYRSDSGSTTGATTLSTAVNDDAWHVVGMTRTSGLGSSGVARLYLNSATHGAEVTGITTATGTFDRFAIGALLRTSTANFLSGRIAAAFAIARELNGTEIGNLVTYLNSIKPS